MFRELWKQIPVTMKIIWGMYLLAFLTILGLLVAVGLKLYMKL